MSRKEDGNGLLVGWWDGARIGIEEGRMSCKRFTGLS